MTKTEYRQYIASPEWQAKRKTFLKYPWAACRRCWMPRWLARIAYDQDLHVHHLSYANLGNETQFDIEPLCRRCHDVETFGRSDLHAPHSHKCPVCSNPTWNPYEDLCERCWGIKASSGQELPDELVFYRKDPQELNVWQSQLNSLSHQVSVDEILCFLAEAEPFFRRNYDLHQRYLKASKLPVEVAE